MGDDSLEKVSGFVPEFAHDILARIVPGAVIFTTLLPSSLEQHKDSPFVGFLGVLFVSYVVGFFADIGTIYIGSKLDELFDAFRTQPKDHMPPQDQKRSEIKVIGEYLDELTPPRRDLAIKLLAETVMCRVLTVYTLVLMICSAATGHWLRFGKQNFYSSHEIRIFPFALIAAAFCVVATSWQFLRKDCNKRCKMLVEEQRKEYDASHAKRMNSDRKFDTFNSDLRSMPKRSVTIWRNGPTKRK